MWQYVCYMSIACYICFKLLCYFTFAYSELLRSLYFNVTVCNGCMFICYAALIYVYCVNFAFKCP